MYCPNCSEKIPQNMTQFCSKCGFLTKNVEDFVQNGGEIDNSRRKGIKQGVKMIILSLLLLPGYLLLSPMFPPNDVLIESSPSNTWFEQIGWAIIWTTFLAGVARIAFAIIFEQKSVPDQPNLNREKQIKENKPDNALPPVQDTPVSNFGKWKITDDLFEPVLQKKKTSGELK